MTASLSSGEAPEVFDPFPVATQMSPDPATAGAAPPIQTAPWSLRQHCRPRRCGGPHRSPAPPRPSREPLPARGDGSRPLSLPRCNGRLRRYRPGTGPRFPGAPSRSRHREVGEESSIPPRATRRAVPVPSLPFLRSRVSAAGVRSVCPTASTSCIRPAVRAPPRRGGRADRHRGDGALPCHDGRADERPGPLLYTSAGEPLRRRADWGAGLGQPALTPSGTLHRDASTKTREPNALAPPV